MTIPVHARADELARHAPAVRRYIAMHDTTAFGPPPRSCRVGLEYSSCVAEYGWVPTTARYSAVVAYGWGRGVSRWMIRCDAMRRIRRSCCAHRGATGEVDEVFRHQLEADGDRERKNISDCNAFE